MDKKELRRSIREQKRAMTEAAVRDAAKKLREVAAK